MKTKKTFTEQTEKEVTTNDSVNFLDRHFHHWFVDKSEIKIGKEISDFLSGNVENFQIKKIHSCDVKTFKLVETVDGKFIFLMSRRMVK